MDGSLISLLTAFVVLGFSNFLSNRGLLHRFKIQGSLIGGLLALITFSMLPDFKETGIFKDWKDWPSYAISFVFAALFLEKRENYRKREKFRDVVLQSIFVYVAILGQILLGIALTLLIFRPFFSLPLSFSSVLENGFAGGHGTAVAMQQAFRDNGLPEGTEFALFSATIGIILGIVGGIFLIRFSDKRYLPQHKQLEGGTHFEMGRLSINLGLVSLSVLCGYILKNFIKQSTGSIPEFPLFIYALFSSVLVRRFLFFWKKEVILNNGILSFLSNFFMEILIFSAIATMNLTVISDALIPLFLLFSAGFLWNLFCHFYIRQKILPPDIGFELSILNFGMLNGTTAIGLMLLKMIDPGLKSRAVKVYAESAPISSPVLGGGILTLSLPYLLNYFNPFLIFLVLLIVTVLLYISGYKYYKFYYGE